MISGAPTPIRTVVRGQWENGSNDGAGVACDEPRLLRSANRRDSEVPPVGTVSHRPPGPDNGPRRDLRTRWVREVMRSAAIGDAARVLLIAMSWDMDERGYVSVLRPELAKRIGRSERRVTERLSEAVAARFLDHVKRGQKGVTPVYRAMLPDRLSGTDHSPLKESQWDGSEPAESAPDRPAEGGFSGTPGGPASTKASGTERRRQTQAHGASTSLLLEEVEAEHGETEHARELRRKARESWGIEGAA